MKEVSTSPAAGTPTSGNPTTGTPAAGGAKTPDILNRREATAKPQTSLWLFATVAVVTVVLDQLSKAWIRGALPQGQEIPVLPGWVHLSHVLNHGAAWGMLSGQRWLLAVIAIVVGSAVIWLARQEQAGNTVVRVALGLILGGALGNLIDRIVAGAVTDFIDLDTPIAWLQTFPVFNLADSALTIGVILLAYDALFRRPKIED